MQDYLIFRLYGPMAAWGDIAIGETRHSYSYPTKTAVLGLLAASLGISRTEEVKQIELATNYSFAVRVDHKGALLCDYHTTQVPPATVVKKNSHIVTRRDELCAGKNELKTILSTREYFCDVCYTVILWGKSAATTAGVDDEKNSLKITLPYSLTALQQALRTPTFPLFLGRKSCALALPISPQICHASTIQEALAQADVVFNQQAQEIGLQFGQHKSFYNDISNISEINKNDDDETSKVAFYWDADASINSGIEPLQTIRRKDQLLSRKRWQFADRFENYAAIDINVSAHVNEQIK